jgi:Small metal-binding protein
MPDIAVDPTKFQLGREKRLAVKSGRATINVWSGFTIVGLAVVRTTRTTSQIKDSPMSRRFIVAMLGLGLALLLMPQFSLAEEDHIAEAITHTKQAIDHGKQGHADVLATHAEAALTHAKASEAAKANPHIAEAIKHLKEAIDEGKQGHADVATTHAEAALNHLEQAM